VTASILDVRLLDRARKDIGEEIEARHDQIVQGLAGDYADYRYRCGQVQGLATALDILGGIIKSMGDGRP